MKFSILDSKTIRENRVDFHLKFTRTQTYCCGHPAASEQYEGVTTLIFENNRWVIDDFLALYESDEALRLSDGYPQCQGDRWVGEPD